MRVQMKTKIGGYRDGIEWPEIGGTIDVPDHEAESLIANGYAEEAVDADQNAAEPAGDEGQAADGDGVEPADAVGSGAPDGGTEADPGVDATVPLTPPVKASKKR